MKEHYSLEDCEQLLAEAQNYHPFDKAVVVSLVAQLKKEKENTDGLTKAIDTLNKTIDIYEVVCIKFVRSSILFLLCSSLFFPYAMLALKFTPTLLPSFLIAAVIIAGVGTVLLRKVSYVHVDIIEK